MSSTRTGCVAAINCQRRKHTLIHRPRLQGREHIRIGGTGEAGRELPSERRRRGRRGLRGRCAIVDTEHLDPRPAQVEYRRRLRVRDRVSEYTARRHVGTQGCRRHDPVVVGPAAGRPALHLLVGVHLVGPHDIAPVAAVPDQVQPQGIVDDQTVGLRHVSLDPLLCLPHRCVNVGLHQEVIGGQPQRHGDGHDQRPGGQRRNTEAPQPNRSLPNGAEQIAQRRLAGARGQKRCQRQRGQDERHRQVPGAENNGGEYHQPDRERPQPLDEQCGQGYRDGQKRQGWIKSEPFVNGMAFERIGIIEPAAGSCDPIAGT